jgi:hypothetical protein
MRTILHGTLLACFIFIAACSTTTPNPTIEQAPSPTTGQDYFLNSSEYKLLLSADFFEDHQAGFAAYWDTIQSVAAAQGIAVRPSEAPLKIGHKKVSFLDTENRDLRKASMLIRRKVKIKKGEQAPGFEYGVKFRDRNPRVALSKDLSLAAGYERKFEEIELESDIVYYSKDNGDITTSYTVSNSIDLDVDPEHVIGSFINYFPILGSLGLDPSTPLSYIAGIEVDEYMIKMGHLEFGDGLEGRMDMTIWVMDTKDGQIVLPEFSFDHPFLKDRKYDPIAMEKCNRFINDLHDAAPEWTIPGELKAATLFYLPQD